MLDLLGLQSSTNVPMDDDETTRPRQRRGTDEKGTKQRSRCTDICAKLTFVRWGTVARVGIFLGEEDAGRIAT